mgnify:CR=1 FL=1
MDTKLIPLPIQKTLQKSLTLFEGILPFTEKPSNKHLSERTENAKDEINASDLFSLFTADIIKEEIIFTR